MTPIEKAIAQLGGQTATARIFGISPQATQQWSVQGRVPAEYCPRIEHLLAGAVRCEELNDRVEWELIRGADLPGKSSGNSTIDHAAELRGAIAQTRLVFDGHRDAQDALEYLEQVLKAGQRAEVPAHACAPAASQAICNLAIKIDTSDLDRAMALAYQFNEMLQGWAPAMAKLKDSIAATMSAAAEKAAAAMAAESAQLVIQAEKAAASVAARATVDLVAVLSRELFSLADKLQQPADLVVQLLVLAELRGMRADFVNYSTS